MTRPWIYLINPFISLLTRSRPGALQASKYTRAQLAARQTDPFFGPLFLYFDPLNEAFVDEQTDLDAQIGTQKGSTSTVDNMLDDLSSDKIDIWDVAIQAVFRKGTPEYIAIFPKGRKPFQQGKKNHRIDAVKSLGIALTGIVALAAVKTAVDAFYDLIKEARDTQTGKIGDTGTDSDEVTVAATAAMNGLFNIYGSCIVQFFETPLVIEPLFDMGVLRDSEQTLFVKTIAAGATAFIVKRTVEPTAKVRLKVNSAHPVKFYMADEKNDVDPTVFVLVDGTEEEIVDFSLLGNVLSAKFLKAINTNDGTEAHIEVELL